jgi:hypothetical protein
MANQTQAATRARQFNAIEAGGVYEHKLRVYKNLFANPVEGRACAELREALRTFNTSIPGSDADALKALRQLNGGEPPPFDTEQIETLRALFVERPISPSPRDGELGKQSRAFWHALVYGEIKQCEELWGILHRYDVGAAGSLEELTEMLSKMAPGHQWSEVYLDALARFAVRDCENRYLAWWDTFHDAW